MKEYKIALVHDELVRRGGAEQVTLLMSKAFPDAPIYTSCYNINNTYIEFKDKDIRTSWLSNFVQSEKWLKRLFYPFSVWAMRSIDLRDYDIVFISTTNCAKYIKTSPKSFFVAFCHYPFRLAWFPESYQQVIESKGIKKILYNLIISRLKNIDYKAAKNIDLFLTNTPEIKEIIKNCYNPTNEVQVVPASITCANYYISKNPREDYYLVVSRVESYKKVDLVVEVFNKLPDRKLIIVGKGSQKAALQKISNSNIEFKEGISTEELTNLYANCKALIFPQKEDYGLTPIEANASGRPVIAYGKGGVLYTTIPFAGDSKKSTSVLFEEQTTESLIEAIKLAESVDFDPQFIRLHAERFDEDTFIEKLRKIIIEGYQNEIKV